MSPEEERCRAVALRILGHRWNSAHELATKLRSRNFDSALVDSTVESLRREGWIDDARFAEAFVEKKLRRKAGRARIERELTNAGVDRAVAKSALATLSDSDAEASQLLELCRKKIRILCRRKSNALLSEEDRQKLVAYLMKQGYDYAAVSATVRTVLDQGPRLVDDSE